MTTSCRSVVVALAGRRADAPDTGPPSFPAAHRGAVAEAIRARLADGSAIALVCSAACGADLLAIEAARDLAIRFRIVLPFDKDRFRATSVADRPGEWGELFDRACAEAEAAGDLVVLGLDGSEAAAYARTTAVILDEGEALAAAAGADRVAIAVWEGPRPDGDDFTKQFVDEATARGWRLAEISTARTIADP